MLAALSVVHINDLAQKQHKLLAVQTVNVTGNDKALSTARKACAGLNPDLDISRGRYPFEMESSLDPLVDRIYL